MTVGERSGERGGADRGVKVRFDGRVSCRSRELAEKPKSSKKRKNSKRDRYQCPIAVIFQIVTFWYGGRGKGKAGRRRFGVQRVCRMGEQLGWWTGARGRFAIITLRYPDLGMDWGG